MYKVSRQVDILPVPHYLYTPTPHKLSLGFWKQESQSTVCQKVGVSQYKRK